MMDSTGTTRLAFWRPPSAFVGAEGVGEIVFFLEQWRCAGWLRLPRCSDSRSANEAAVADAFDADVR